MEIASPLTFHRSSTTGTKRQFSTSSPMAEQHFDVPSSGSSVMADAAKHDTPMNPFKRRRCFEPTDESTTENSHNFSSVSSQFSLLDRGNLSSLNSNIFFNGNMDGECFFLVRQSKPTLAQAGGCRLTLSGYLFIFSAAKTPFPPSFRIIHKTSPRRRLREYSSAKSCSFPSGRN